METLITLLKALADGNRLTIVALLAQAPRSGEELAALLNLKPSTISHHLSRLHKAGLIESMAAQYYHIYSLNENGLAELRCALTPEQLTQEAITMESMATIDSNAYRDQVLARWVTNNRLHGLPTPIKQREIVVQWLAEKFTPNRRYAPAQVDDLLDAWCSWTDPRQLDITTATRALVDSHLITRTGRGEWYWRADSALATGMADFAPEQLPQADRPPREALVQSPLRALVRLAMFIPANRALTGVEIDELIQRHHGDQEAEPATVRAALIAEGLLQASAADAYQRPTIGPDHPTTTRLRTEALAVQVLREKLK